MAFHSRRKHWFCLSITSWAPRASPIPNWGHSQLPDVHALDTDRGLQVDLDILVPRGSLLSVVVVLLVLVPGAYKDSVAGVPAVVGDPVVGISAVLGDPDTPTAAPVDTDGTNDPYCHT